VCSLAEVSATCLWERNAQRWHAVTAMCTKKIIDGARPREARHAAACTLGACLAAPWGSCCDGASAAAAEAMKKTCFDKLIFQPLAKAVAAEDRCVPAVL
jgi:hypothetical protein